MEDKSFELLTQMYKEFSEFRKETNNRFDEVKSDIQKVSNQVVKLENNYGKKLDALMDGYQQLSEGQKGLESQITDMSSKLDNQEVEITAIKRVR